jgi:iron complex outermembrane recepter protein
MPICRRLPSRFGSFALLLAASMTLHAQEFSQEKDFNIPAQPLSKAVIQFSDQSGIQVVTAGQDVSKLNTAGVKGRLKIDQALKALLKGTQLSYTVVGNSTVALANGASPSSSRDESDATKEAGKTTSQDFRVAQLDQNAVGPRAIGSDQDSEGKKQEGLSEIVVTGTHIAGASPVGSSVKIYDRADIEQSGAGSLDQFARQMTENASSVDPISNGVSNANFGVLNGASSNYYYSSAFNLHGLGPQATLTLLNGQRIAPAGSDGSLVDSSMIPLAIIDHIEVLTDGASAIYGSDAVAGVVNIITRKDFDGAESALRYGEATSGGASELTASQVVGKSWNSGDVFVSYEFDRQGGLDASQRDYIPDQAGPQSLIPTNRRNSFFVSAGQDVGDTRLSGNLLYSERSFGIDATDDNDYFQESASSSGKVSNTGATLALDQPLFRDWHASLTGNYSRLQQSSSSQASVLESFGAIQESISTPATSTAQSAELLTTGSLISLPGGTAKIALGGDYRRETFSSNAFVGETLGGVLTEFPPSPVLAQRHVESIFGELEIPVVRAENSIPGISRLEISVAGRYDHYSDFGSTTNPKVGLVWAPVRSINFRGTYGTSFHAPLLSQIGQPVTYSTNDDPNPNAPGGLTDTLQIAGGNGRLKPETSSAHDIGIDVRPSVIPSLSFSADYFHIDYSNRISTPPTPNTGEILTSPLTAPFVTLNPPLSEVEAIFNTPPGVIDSVMAGPTGVGAIFDSRFANIARTLTSGVSAHLAYDLPTSGGKLSFSSSVDRLIEDRLQVVSGAPYSDLVNTFGNPPRWKARGAITFSPGAFVIGTAINYVGSYQNSLITPSPTIESWTTVDTYIGYHFDSTWGTALSGFRVSLSVQNIADTKPPAVIIPQTELLPGQAYIPFDPVNASPVGRFIALRLSKAWGKESK